MNQRIDLSTVPSAMETLAASWAGKGLSGRERALTPTSPPKHPLPPPAPPKWADLPKPVHSNGRSEYRAGPRQLPPKEEAGLNANLAQDIAKLRRIIAPPEPDPERYVQNLPPYIGASLLAATRCKDPEGAGHYHVQPGPLVQQMYDMGLLARIGKHHRILSAFAVAVRREVMKDIG